MSRNGSPRSSSAEPITDPSAFTDRTSTAMRSGAAPFTVTRRSTSAATACACARSERQRQKRTSPPRSPRSGLSMRSSTGSTTARAALRMREPER